MILSIITINKNNASGLLKTIQSVVYQTFTDFEYIIIDGASTDESCEIIEIFKSNIQHFTSEPDNGIYNAMNKGISLASGDYIYFLNSGDIFNSNDVLMKISNYLDGTDFLFGFIKRKYKRGLIVEKIPSILSFSYIVRFGINHQATFTKKAVFLNQGMYDEKLKITSDWKFLLNAIVNKNTTYKVVNIIITIYDQYGVSGNSKKLQEEKANILKLDYCIYIPDLKKLSLLDYFSLSGINRKIRYYLQQIFFK